jgi:hypothetical protein
MGLQLHDERSELRGADILATMCNRFTPEDVARLAPKHSDCPIRAGISHTVISECVKNVLGMGVLLFAFAGLQPELKNPHSLILEPHREAC